MNGDGPRGAPLSEVLGPAVDAWVGVCGGRSLDDALARARVAHGASPTAASALRDVLATALRGRACAAWIRGALVARPAPERLAALLDLAIGLRLAGRYADHVLVDEAVGAARREAGQGAAGFVNGVLRSFLRRAGELESGARADPARRGNVPAWWYARLVTAWGEARAQEMLAAQQREPAMVLRANLRRGGAQAALASLAAEGLEAQPLGGQALRLARPRPVECIAAFARGEVSVQDAGAQLAARWLAPAAGERVLDACAAPGGKTAHLLELADCLVDSVEADPVRAARIAPGLERLGFPGAGPGPRVRLHVADAADPSAWWDGKRYDRILLDAPCTGSGVVSRHPDIPWLRRATDVAKSATQQARLLDSLWPLLAPAGRFLYVVCSVFPEEGLRQVESFLRRQPQARAAGIAGSSCAWLQLAPGGGVLAPAGEIPAGLDLPADHDGFFFALLEKAKAP